MIGRLAAWLGLSCALLAPISLACDSAAPISFEDATPSSGIDYTNLCGAAPADKGWITETMGAGAAWLDYDGDGHLDLYLVNGSTHDRPADGGAPNRLYRGDGRGRFRDVTADSGAGDRGWGFGVAVGDYDNDGDPDLYVTNLGGNVLLRNRGDGRFVDVAKSSGTDNASWGSSSAFFDMEGDGDLDLYVANYVDFDVKTVPRRGTKRATPPFCAFKGMPVVCGPMGLPPAQDALYRNDGGGKFTDVTRRSGLRLEPARYALGVVSADFDNDGDADLYVANDSRPNSLWRNRGDGTFEETGLTLLAALNADGIAQAGMGVDAADYDADGWIDLVVTNFSHDLNTIYRNHAGKFFSDESLVAGMGPTVLTLSWGVGFRDFDNDADLDLFIANGHVYPEMTERDVGTSFLQPNHLFANREGRFQDVSASAGSALRVERSFRGAAFGDYDEDGDLDIVVTALDAPVLLMRNVGSHAGNHLRVRLVGSASNRDGVGARVSVTAGGRVQVREKSGGGSYLSASEGVLHFGLGTAAKAERIEVRWPSGRKSALSDVQANRSITIEEPE